jgi:hypothetical protein
MKRHYAVSILSLVLFSLAETKAADMSVDKPSGLQIHHLAKDFNVTELDSNEWKLAPETVIKTYWSGENAPKGRQFSARLLWSDTGLYVRFEANQDEPLIVSEKPNADSKTRGLWDRDVCEIFVAPDRTQPRRYFEFEVAPTGEWVDLALYTTPKKRETDWEYKSGMHSAARIEKGKITMAIKVDWKALGKTPKAGDVWRGNLFRCIGKDPTRGYLAWQPTLTTEPAFHVPEKFGEFMFVN